MRFKLVTSLMVGINVMAGTAAAASVATGTVRIGVTLVVPLQVNPSRQPEMTRISMSDGATLGVPSQSPPEHIKSVKAVKLKQGFPEEVLSQTLADPHDSIVLVSDTFVAQ